MKKKLIAVAAVILIVVLTCSLAACNSKSMFDGKFTKEASNEEAQNSWTTAQKAFGEDSSELATASAEEEKAPVEGWKGMKISMNANSKSGYVRNGVKTENIIKMSGEGSLLFDASAIALTATSDFTYTYGEDTESKSITAGTYVQDKTMYSNLKVGEKELKAKFAPEVDVASGAIKEAMSELTSSLSETALKTIAEAICDMSYTELLNKYDGFKAYINNSGDYNRIKYVFTAEMIADMNSEDEDFVKNAVLGECAIIIVTDKATGAFQGAKLDMNFSYNGSVDEDEISMDVKSSISIENCSEVNATPKNADEYKDIKDCFNDAMELLKALAE